MPATLATLFEGLDVRLIRGAGDTSVADVTEDSRAVEPGALFVARRGEKSDGRRFVGDAIGCGAAAVLSDDAELDTGGRPLVVADDVMRVASVAAERLHGRPSSRLHLIGITGTNGKTTTAHLVQQLLNAGGRRCGLIGTVRIDDGRRVEPAILTTPTGIELSRLLSRMVANGCTHAVMEVSSHALVQGRVTGLTFRTAVFTNLSGDHLDYHRSMEAYAAAKAHLFESLGTEALAVINADDAEAARMVRDCRARVWRCSTMDTGEADCWARVGAMTARSMRVDASGPWGEMLVDLPLVGRHNAANALQAAAVAFDTGVGASELARGLASCQAPPGRLEPVTAPDDPFAVLVDYAHTDDALDNVLGALRPLVKSPGRLIVVFGCGGDRDPSKRPRMAAVACRWADRVWITSDNPRTEDPAAIVRDIERGIPGEVAGKVSREIDRRAAIEAAITEARPGDVILIAGKGHEDYQIVGTQKRPFDDRIAARQALESRSRMATGATA